MTSPIARQPTATATVLAAGATLPKEDLTRWLGEVARRHGGRVVESSGDGVMAAFDAAAPALAAAVDMQERTSTNEVGLRIGVAAGDVTWERSDRARPPIVAAGRLQAAASEGQILVTDVVRLLAGEQDVERYEPITDVERLPGSTTAYRLRWAAPGTADAARPPPSPPLPLTLRAPVAHTLVGRSQALASLERSWRLAARGRPDRPHRW